MPFPASGSRPSAMASAGRLELDDVVIAVFGPTGSGKSTFICSASGGDVKERIGHTLRSATDRILPTRFLDEETGRAVVLVDTPGFDSALGSDSAIMDTTFDWLRSSYHEDKRFSGILYLHPISHNRMPNAPLKDLRAFRELCGKDTLEKVYFTTTMWDEVHPEVGERRLDELERNFWAPMTNQGAQVVCCTAGDDSPKRIVRQIIADEEDREMASLRQEMAKFKGLSATPTGRQLYLQLEKLVKQRSELLQKIAREREAGVVPGVLVQLHVDYNQLRTPIDEGLRQMRELQLSQPKKTSFFSFLKSPFRKRD